MFEIPETSNLLDTLYYNTAQEHYWSTPIPYSGQTLDLYKLLHLRADLCNFIVNEAYNILHPKYPDVPYEVIRVEVLCTNINKSFLITAIDAKEILLSGIIDTEFISKTGIISHDEYHSVIKDILKGILERDNRYNSLVSRGLIDYFTTYHDIAGHRLVRELAPDDVIDELCFTSRMQRNQPMNTHFIFGKLLAPLFRDCCQKNFDRRTIFETMVSKLVLYLEGKTSLCDGDGNCHFLGCQVTQLEADYATRSHAGEPTVSHYAPVLYTRYREDNVYQGDYLDKFLLKADLYSFLVRLSQRTQRSIYQDSFYMRDEVIQTAFSKFA